MLRLLQFTDMHLRDDAGASVRGVVPQRCFERVLYHAQQQHWPPDAVLLTGDIANDEFEHTYPRIANTVAGWQLPTLAIPGNHDDVAKLRAAFDRISYAADEILDFDRWRIVGLNSQVADNVHGAIDAQGLRLLDEAAASRGDRHLLVALHHQPLSIGTPWMEDIGLHQAPAFRARLRHLGVRACLFGHVHQAWDSVENGVRYLGTPSTGRQFEPRASEFKESDDPPAYRWLHLHEDGRIVTDVVWVE